MKMIINVPVVANLIWSIPKTVNVTLKRIYKFKQNNISWHETRELDCMMNGSTAQKSNGAQY